MKYYYTFLIIALALGPALAHLQSARAFPNNRAADSNNRLHGEPRITNGTNCKQHQFPWMTGIITINDKGQGVCTGTLISSKTVLTAAHCVEGFSRFVITFGDYNIKNATDQEKILYNVTKAIHHEGFNKTGNLENDVAVIILNEPIPETEHVKYARLPTLPMRNDTFAGSLATIGGFGNTVDLLAPEGFDGLCHWAENRKIMSNADCEKRLEKGLQSTMQNGMQEFLNVVQQKVLNDDLKEELETKLREVLKTLAELPEGSLQTPVSQGNICIDTSDEVGACAGDSGGMLMLQSDDGGYYHVGVASFVASGCRSGSPNIFARTTHYLDWILKNGEGIEIRP